MFNIVLYTPEIPWNTGNIGRLCLANNCILHLIQPLGFQLDDKNVKRAGMDYWAQVQYILHDSWEAFLQSQIIDNPAAQIYLLTTKASDRYWDIQYKQNDYFVFGPESKGLPTELINHSDYKAITIPMFNHPTVRSLNLSTSAGIVLYEGIRQVKG